MGLYFQKKIPLFIATPFSGACLYNPTNMGDLCPEEFVPHCSGIVSALPGNANLDSVLVGDGNGIRFSKEQSIERSEG